MIFQYCKTSHRIIWWSFVSNLQDLNTKQMGRDKATLSTTYLSPCSPWARVGTRYYSCDGRLCERLFKLLDSNRERVGFTIFWWKNDNNDREMFGQMHETRTSQVTAERLIKTGLTLHHNYSVINGESYQENGVLCNLFSCQLAITLILSPKNQTVTICFVSPKCHN